MTERYITYGFDTFNKEFFNAPKNDPLFITKPMHGTGMWASPCVDTEYSWRQFRYHGFGEKYDIAQDGYIVFTLKNTSKTVYLRELNDIFQLPLKAFELKNRIAFNPDLKINKYIIESYKNQNEMVQDIKEKIINGDLCKIGIDFEKARVQGISAIDYRRGNFLLDIALDLWDVDSLLVLEPNCINIEKPKKSDIGKLRVTYSHHLTHKCL